MRKILSIVLVFYSDDACEIAAVEICEEKSFDLPRRKPLQLWLAFIPWGVFFEGSLKGPRRGGGGRDRFWPQSFGRRRRRFLSLFSAFPGFGGEKRFRGEGKGFFEEKEEKGDISLQSGDRKKKVGKLKDPGRDTFLVFLPICCVLIERVYATTTGYAHTSVLRGRNSPVQNQIRGRASYRRRQNAVGQTAVAILPPGHIAFTSSSRRSKCLLVK